MTELEVVPGIGRKTAEKLRGGGVPNAEYLARLDPRTLHEDVSDLELAQLERAIANARELVGINRSHSGVRFEEAELAQQRLTTGLAHLDRYLYGGFTLGSVVEVYGQARAGKSQLCHQLAVTSLLPTELGGLGGTVLWLDSERSFSPSVIRANAIRQALDPDEVLDKIHVHQIVNRHHLMETIGRIQMDLRRFGARLLVVDNIGKFFRVEVERLDWHRYMGRDLLDLMEQLHRVASSLDCVVVYANQVYTKLATYGGNPNEPVGDHIMAHGPTHRFYIRKGLKAIRKIELVDHAAQAPRVFEATLGWGGFFESSDNPRKLQKPILEYLSTHYGFDLEVGRAWVTP